MDGNTDLQQEPNFRDLVRLVRRGLVFALAVAVGAALLTYFLTKRATPTYKATATVLESQPDSGLQRFGVSLVTAPMVDITAYQAAAISTPVVTTAMESLGLKNPSERQVEALLKNVTIRADSSQQSSLLHIDVKSGSPKDAANTADALAYALLNWDKQRATQNLRKIVEALRGQIGSLSAQIAQVQAAKAPDAGQLSGLQSLRAQQALQLNSAQALENSAVGNLEILEPASVPLEPVLPRPKSDAALAFVLGIFLVYGLVLLRDALETRFRNTEELARTTTAPVMAEFPRMSGASRHLPREAANYLRTNLLFSIGQDQPMVFLVTSSRPMEGKTSVAMSLAESFARNDYRTLLIDGDLRRPRIGAEYNLSPHSNMPLRSFLESPHRAMDPAVVDVGRAKLHVIPSFAPAPSPSELLARGFARVVGRFSEDYDVMVVDSAPVLPVADALTMAPHTSGVVFLVSLPTAERRGVNASLALLERIGAPVLGVVATNLESVRNRGDEYGYGYGYGVKPSAEAPSSPSRTQGTAGGHGTASLPATSPSSSQTSMDGGWDSNGDL